MGFTPCPLNSISGHHSIVAAMLLASRDKCLDWMQFGAQHRFANDHFCTVRNINTQQSHASIPI
jgi:hypothetical protein